MVAKTIADVEDTMTLVKAARERHALANEKSFEFNGSNLLQSEKQLTLDAPQKDICGRKHIEAGGKSKCALFNCIQMHL